MRLGIQRTLLQLLQRQGLRLLRVVRRLIVLPGVKRRPAHPRKRFEVFAIHAALAAVGIQLGFRRRKIVLFERQADVIDNSGPRHAEAASKVRIRRNS